MSTTRLRDSDVRGHASRARWVGLALAMAVTAASLLGVSIERARAQETPRAGLVVMLADDDVRELCVALPAAEISGSELLMASGLTIRAEESSMGVMVCQIEDTGCPDGEPCMCACQTAGGDCSYWAYSVLIDGRWGYSDVGASDRLVKHGDVDGWAWGSGSETSGPVPPVRTFEQLCGGDAGAVADNVSEEGREAGGMSGGAGGYLVLVAVVLVLGGIWIWSRRS